MQSWQFDSFTGGRMRSTSHRERKEKKKMKIFQLIYSPNFQDCLSSQVELAVRGKPRMDSETRHENSTYRVARKKVIGLKRSPCTLIFLHT